MNLEFTFLTYVLALVALATAVYAVICIRDIEKRLEHKSPKKKQPLPPITITRSKGHWD